MVLSSKRRRRQLAAGAIALLGLVAVNSARNATLPTRALALNGNGSGEELPRGVWVRCCCYHLNEVRPSQAGVPGSSEYGASLSTSYGTYVRSGSGTATIGTSSSRTRGPTRRAWAATARRPWLMWRAPQKSSPARVPCPSASARRIRTKRRRWASRRVLVSNKLYFFNCDATWIFSRPKDYVDTGSRNNSSRSRRWPRPTGLQNSARQRTGPSTRRTAVWLMGEVKDDWAHGAGFGCTGVQEPRDSSPRRGDP